MSGEDVISTIIFVAIITVVCSFGCGFWMLLSLGVFFLDLILKGQETQSNLVLKPVMVFLE